METQSITKEAAEKNRRWFIVDAKGQVLGRLASQIASYLRGKHTARYTAHEDTGDFVIVINAGEIKLTGKKEEKKMYYRHTGWVGGVVGQTAAELRAKTPTDLVANAVWGMMPKGPLGRRMYKKLKVYAGADHPHAAQKPSQLTLQN